MFEIFPKKKVKCFSLQIIGYVEKDFLAAGKKSNLSPFSEKNKLQYQKCGRLL